MALDPISVKDSGNVAANPNPVMTQARTSKSGKSQIIRSPDKVNVVINTAMKDRLLNLLNSSEATKPDGTPRKVLDVSRMKALGWKPTITLDEGIASTIAWYIEANARGEVRK